MSRLQKCRSSLPREVLIIINSYAENLRPWLVPKPPFHSQLDDLMFPSCSKIKFMCLEQPLHGCQSSNGCFFKRQYSLKQKEEAFYPALRGVCVCSYQVCVLTENTKWTINLRVATLNVYCNTTPVRASLRLTNTNGVQNLPLDFNGLTLHKINNIHNDGLSEKCQECQLQETTDPCFEAV